MSRWIKRSAVVGGVAALAATSAQAAVDTSAVITAMTEAGAAIAVVGAAYLVVKVGTRVYKWIASAL